MSVKDSKHAFATRVIHGGQRPDPLTGAVMPPIYATSTYVQASPGVHKGYEYSRTANPTRDALQAAVANLEAGHAGFAFASGMAAIATILELLDAGSHIIAMHDLYGGSYRLMRDVLPRLGIKVHHVENNLAGVEKLVNSRTRMLYTETPTNPTLRIVDLRKAVALSKRFKLVSLVDNTFASPALQKPLELGFDMVAHSTTKYLGGHSDLIGGAVAGKKVFIDKVRMMVIYLGGSMDPEGAFLLIRGMKSLGPRVRQQCATAMEVAKYLSKHAKVSRVHYPGLKTHPDHLLAKRQMTDFGAMMAFDLKGGLPAARRFCDRTHLFLMAASLGGVESLCVLPIYTSHYKMSKQELAGAGVEPGTVRISVGLEDSMDLIQDLRQALA